MIKIDASNMDYKKLNDLLKSSDDDILIDNCCGQRFIAAGFEKKNITINGTPGNALCAYLNGSTVKINGNVQDAVGDTMNDGKIIVYGNAGDTLGYAMRGGKIFIRGNSGYRTGIHMKEYKNTNGFEKMPVIVVGGSVGSFLGEYIAGGIIIVLGMYSDNIPVGNFTGTGMHGGSIFIRSKTALKDLPNQVSSQKASETAMKDIAPILTEYASDFNMNIHDILRGDFYHLKPNTKNPYKQLYTKY